VFTYAFHISEKKLDLLGKFSDFWIVISRLCNQSFKIEKYCTADYGYKGVYINNVGISFFNEGLDEVLYKGLYSFS